MDTMASFVRRILFLGAFMCITASANLMMDYNWPVPDRNINLFPHESSCHYYYLMLSEEDITIEKCPDGQLFDYVKHRCISDKEHIHCWSRHFAKLKHDHTHMKHKKHFKCPYPWGKYPNLHDCSKYHLCLNGKSKVKKCAHYELFDKVSRKCIASIDAVCADRTDVVEHGYVCPKTWGSFTYSKDCSKYYECLQKKPSLRTCQKGKLFDDRLRKCAPQEHVYCGVRHNPYEKVISDVPETSSVPNTISNEKSTIPGTDVAETTLKEKIVSVKPTSQEIKEISQEISSTFKLATSTPQENSSTFKNEVTTAPQENSSTFKEEVTTAPQENSSTFKEEASSTPQENSSTFKEEVSSKPQETSSTLKKITLIPQESSSSFNEVTLTNEPINTETSSSSALPKDNGNNAKQESSIATADPNDIVPIVVQTQTKVTGDLKKDAIEVAATTEKQQVEVVPQAISDDESENLKKDVSTEERDTDDSSTSEKGPEAVKDSSTTKGCLPDDSMCLIEKDGTVVKCSGSKNLQPHPKDERRYMDCSESKIKIYSCPPPLTFHPNTEKCKWQFVMGSK